VEDKRERIRRKQKQTEFGFALSPRQRVDTLDKSGTRVITAPENSLVVNHPLGMKNE
jgi:hypothetical protein